MVAAQPNPSPKNRRQIDHSHGAVTQPAQRVIHQSKTPDISPEAWEFKPQLLKETYAYTFVCSSCTGLGPYTVIVPIAPFIEAVANQPINIIAKLTEIKNKFRGRIDSVKHQNKFSTDNVKTIAQHLVKFQKIPFDPFNPYNIKYRRNESEELKKYSEAYKKAITKSDVGTSVEDLDEALKISVDNNPPERVVSVQGASVPESKIDKPVIDNNKLTILTVKKTLERVGLDKTLAQTYYELEINQPNPRKSLKEALLKVIDK